MVSRREKLLHNLFKKEKRVAITPEIRWAKKIISATVKAITSELREEAQEANFGESERGENYLLAVPESTIIRIRDEWLENE